MRPLIACFTLFLALFLSLLSAKAPGKASGFEQLERLEYLVPTSSENEKKEADRAELERLLTTLESTQSGADLLERARVHWGIARHQEFSHFIHWGDVSKTDAI